MTHDDIIRMAKEAGWHDGLLGVSFTVPLLERFAALVAAEKDKEIERLQVALAEANTVREACNQRAFRLEAEIERLRDELRQSSIDHTRAEVERLREALKAETSRCAKVCEDAARRCRDAGWDDHAAVLRDAARQMQAGAEK